MRPGVVAAAKSDKIGGNPMKDNPNSSWDDERIVDYIRFWAIERSKCGRDGYGANRLNERHVFPAGEILKERGTQSLAKLLPLLQDDNADVRLSAASLAYEVDGPACLRMLEELAKTPNMVGIMAWVTISLKAGPDAVPDPARFGG
jgi:hypothetical protein